MRREKFSLVEENIPFVLAYLRTPIHNFIGFHQLDGKYCQWCSLDDMSFPSR
jgi:hypothetical protein